MSKVVSINKKVSNYLKQISEKCDLTKGELEEMEILLKAFVGMGMTTKEVKETLTDYNIHL